MINWIKSLFSQKPDKEVIGFEFEGKRMVEVSYTYSNDFKSIGMAIKVLRHGKSAMKWIWTDQRDAKKYQSQQVAIEDLWSELKADHRELTKHLKRPKVDGTWGGLING